MYKTKPSSSLVPVKALGYQQKDKIVLNRLKKQTTEDYCCLKLLHCNNDLNYNVKIQITGALA